jgi:hypothetical protein
MNLLPVLLLTLTTATTLVLRSGDRITTDGAIREDNGVVTFRVKGTLYSLPASEIEHFDNSDSTTPPAAAPVTPAAASAESAKLRVSEEDRKRLIAALEKNHAGTPTPAEQTVTPLPPAPAAPDEKAVEQDEWAWRRQAQGYEEDIRRAKEELELLETRAHDLQWRIFTLTNMGYKPSSFTYDSAQLQRALDQIPRARLEITRAERAYAEFREEARRRGITPGWLR